MKPAIIRTTTGILKMNYGGNSLALKAFSILFASHWQRHEDNMNAHLLRGRQMKTTGASLLKGSTALCAEDIIFTCVLNAKNPFNLLGTFLCLFPSFPYNHLSRWLVPVQFPLNADSAMRMFTAPAVLPMFPLTRAFVKNEGRKDRTEQNLAAVITIRAATCDVH